jgi:hypothetical protein
VEQAEVVYNAEIKRILSGLFHRYVRIESGSDSSLVLLAPRNEITESIIEILRATLRSPGTASGGMSASVEFAAVDPGVVMKLAAPVGGGSQILVYLLAYEVIGEHSKPFCEQLRG